MRNNDFEKMLELGDVIYKINKNNTKKIVETKVTRVDRAEMGHYVYNCDATPDFFLNRAIGRTYFKTKEGAETALKRNEKISKKRALLKEYETEVNKELGLTDHWVIK